MSLFRPTPVPLSEDTGSDRAVIQAMEHLRQMNAERRAELERQWNDPDFVFDAFGEPSNVR